MEFRLMTTQCKRTVANNFVLLAVSFFLLSRCCCCHADVEHRVKDIQNNATAGIILSVQSKEISGELLSYYAMFPALFQRDIINFEESTTYLNVFPFVIRFE